MTLPIERARSRRPITWLTLLGVLLLPVVIGGVLVAALNNPTERLGNMRAAIVNEDSPVTLNGQLVPLGRQLSAGLVEGSDDVPSNLDWTISNADDAASGLADGTYQAVVTIPEDFSAAATSTQPGATPEKATIRVETAPDARIVDSAITAQIAAAASSTLGQQLSEAYLQNVLVGFTTLGGKLGEAADGATQLATGATGAATGATGLADGASQLAGGASQLAGGAGSLADGLGTIADKTSEAAGGVGQLASGISSQLSPEQAAQLSGGLGQVQSLAGTTATGVTDLAGSLAALSSGCVASGGAPAFCANLAAVAAGSQQLTQAANGTKAAADATIPGAQGAATGLAAVGPQAQSVSDGLAQLAGGIRQSQSGAVQLQSGAQGLSSGAAQLSTGADSLATGLTTLGDGVASLGSGLQTAASSLPTSTEQEAKDLATVVADPVTTAGTSSNLFGGSAIPLLATLALWIGGLASFVALRAIPAAALESRRPSALLAARALLPAAAIGALQGVLVAGVAQIAVGYPAGEWGVFALLCAAAGIAFAAVHQALVAVVGGTGRWIAAVVAVLFVATGVVSTVPGWLAQLASFLPTAPAYTGMLAAVTPAGGAAAGAVGLLVWAALAFLATTLATVRRRTTSVRALLASPAPA